VRASERDLGGAQGEWFETLVCTQGPNFPSHGWSRASCVQLAEIEGDGRV
jgi:hypothetical protein